MPTPTYIPLATVTLGSSASSVTFSSIPATFRDLVLVVNGTGSGSNLDTTFNGDTGSNYSRVVMFGGPTSVAQATRAAVDANIQTTNPQPTIHQIMDYSATDKHKTVLSRGPGGSMQVARWADTAAITSCNVDVRSGTFNTGSTLNLYGIAS